jgi:hypothetical protein
MRSSLGTPPSAESLTCATGHRCRVACAGRTLFRVAVVLSFGFFRATRRPNGRHGISNATFCSASSPRPSRRDAARSGLGSKTLFAPQTVSSPAACHEFLPRLESTCRSLTRLSLDERARRRVPRWLSACFRHYARAR